VFTSGTPDGSAGPGNGAGAASGADGRPLYLRTAGRCELAAPSAAARDPGLRTFLADLVRPYGIGLNEDELARGEGQTYAELAAPLVPTAADPPADLLMLAYQVPDVCPDHATASYLSHLCPGEPMAFALCDQGSAAPFTCLRLAREYRQTGGCDNVLLFIAEQAALGHEAGEPAAQPGKHVSVMLQISDSGPVRLAGLRQWVGVTAAEVPGLVAGWLAAAAGERAPVLVAGGELARSEAFGAAAEVRAAPDGQPATGVWWELAGQFTAWASAGRRVVLADYDPGLGYLCLATLDPAA
jgi:4-hydroxymandelate oxidase